MAIIIVPGPSVMFTLARGVAYGRTVAVLTVLGNTIGTWVLSIIIAIGLGPLLSRSSVVSTIIEVLGGSYLLWLGVHTMRERRSHVRAMTIDAGERPGRPRIIREGFTVGILNPKSLVFFAAVFPHFVDHSRGSATSQLLMYGTIFSVLAFASDSTWGLIAGTARVWLSGRTERLVLLRTVGACVMLGLGSVVLVGALRG